MRLIRAGSVVAALLLPAVALVELVGNRYTANVVPSQAAFAPAVGILRSEHQAGDLVVIAPRWLNQGRVALGDWMPIEDETRGDTYDYPRIWELAVDGYEAPEAAGLPLISRRVFDRHALALYRNTRWRPAVWRAMDEYASAEVAVVVDGEAKPCPWQERERRHSCAPAIGEPWVWIGPTTLTDIGFRLRRCLWTHPTEKGAVRVRFTDVPSGTLLTGTTALAYAAYRDTNWQAPVYLDVEIDGRPMGRTVQRGDAPTTRFSYAVPAGGERRTVGFLVSTASQGMRHFCFDAAMRTSAATAAGTPEAGR